MKLSFLFLDMGNGWGCFLKELFRDADFFLCAQFRYCCSEYCKTASGLKNCSRLVVSFCSHLDEACARLYIQMDFQVSHMWLSGLSNQLSDNPDLQKEKLKDACVNRPKSCCRQPQQGKIVTHTIQKAAWYQDLKQLQISEEASS